MMHYKRLLSASKNGVLVFTIVFAVNVLSSFDSCWQANTAFVFSPSWKEHLHSSEEWAIYYQLQALRDGRPWLSRDSPPQIATDVFRLREYYYAPFEPLTAFMLLPFYVAGQIFFGQDFLIRSVLLGMIFYTCLGALFLREISSQLNQSRITADAAAFLFAFATMAFSYSRLLYPQPIVGLFTFLTILFLLNYRRKRSVANLFYASLFYGFSVSAFNASIIAAPFILYFLIKNKAFEKGARNCLTIGLGLLPAILLFVGWNHVVTGNPLMSPRQVVHASISFDFAHLTESGMWLNCEGLFGSLFSPLGIFFVSPVLFASFAGFSSLRSRAEDVTMLLSSFAVCFWLFMSFMNLGGYAGRDFWVGGWANIARFMYVPSSILILFASETFEVINRHRNVLGAWFVSISCVISVLANFSYGVRHDLMVAHLKDYVSNNLVIWPYHLDSGELIFLLVITILATLVYPILLAMKHRVRLS
jgi:hypothetical protein